MEFIKGITFVPFAKRGDFERDEVYESLDRLVDRTSADFVILVPFGLQDTPQSEKISYEETVSADELARMIIYIQNRGLRVAVKPTVNCKNGTWRAHINFFDEDVPCEPKWSNWFASYTEFQLHFARVAQECGCDMFIAGCEMVQTERRAEEWRQVIAKIKMTYSGPVSYNTDKYQEHNVSWWDAVDVISSSGYYPVDDWERQLDRIEAVVKKYNKPFFFAEAGCMSTAGSNHVPNDWSVKGALDLEGQAEWYRAMFAATDKRSWVQGFGLWAWNGIQQEEELAGQNKGYDIYAKPAEKIVEEYYVTK